MGFITWLRAKTETNPGWLLFKSLPVLSFIMAVSANRGPDMVFLFNYSFSSLFIVAVINTIITLLAVYLGYNQKRKCDKLRESYENKELEKLIKPLYLAFEKYPARKFIEMLSYPPEMWGTVVVKGTFADSKNKEFPGAELLVNSAIDIMLNYRELAQPQLQDIIDKYLAMRRDRRNKSGPYADRWHPYFEDAEKLITEISILIRERYIELTS